MNLKKPHFGLLILSIAIVITICFAYYTITTLTMTRRINRDYNFNGIIEKVHYSIKGFPEITIKNRSYCLDAGYNFEYKIENGDSLIKKKGSTVYKLIKNKTHEIFYFNDGNL